MALRVDSARLPSLRELGLLGVVRLEGPDPSFRALQHLTSLHVAFWEQKRQRVAAAVLQRAQPSLRCLEVGRELGRGGGGGPGRLGLLQGWRCL